MIDSDSDSGLNGIDSGIRIDSGGIKHKSLHDSARLGSSRTLQVGTWVTSTRFESARLSSAGYSGFDSSPLLAQAQLGAPDLDWGINSMLDSAQLGVWLGLSSGSGRR